MRALQADVGGAERVVDFGKNQAVGAVDEFELVGEAKAAVEVGEGHAGLLKNDE